MRDRLTALVTGASRGIGAVIAGCLAARGVRVVVHYRADAAAAEATRTALPGEGHVTCQADLADAAATAALWREAQAACGRMHILVNNAGVFFDHPPLTTSLEDWSAAWAATLATNLVGPSNLSLLAAQSMAAAVPLGEAGLSGEAGRSGDPGGGAGGGWGRGRIVNISSRGAFRGEPEAPAYGASKAGLNALSQSMAKALAPAGVYVYCIAPGFVDTDMAAASLGGPQGPGILAQHPLGRVSLPVEVAQASAFCALDAPAAMTGCIIDVNGASYLRT